MESKTPKTVMERGQAMRTHTGIVVGTLLVVLATFPGNVQGMELEKRLSTSEITPIMSAASAASDLISVLGLYPGESIQPRGRVNEPAAEQKDPRMGALISPLDHHAHAVHQVNATKNAFTFVEIGEYKQSKGDYLRAVAPAPIPGITVGIGFRF